MGLCVYDKAGQVEAKAAPKATSTTKQRPEETVAPQSVAKAMKQAAGRKTQKKNVEPMRQNYFKSRKFGVQGNFIETNHLSSLIP